MRAKTLILSHPRILPKSYKVTALFLSHVSRQLDIFSLILKATHYNKAIVMDL